MMQEARPYTIFLFFALAAGWSYIQSRDGGRKVSALLFASVTGLLLTRGLEAPIVLGALGLHAAFQWVVSLKGPSDISRRDLQSLLRFAAACAAGMLIYLPVPILALEHGVGRHIRGVPSFDPILVTRHVLLHWAAFFRAAYPMAMQPFWLTVIAGALVAVRRLWGGGNAALAGLLIVTLAVPLAISPAFYVVSTAAGEGKPQYLLLAVVAISFLAALAVDAATPLLRSARTRATAAPICLAGMLASSGWHRPFGELAQDISPVLAVICGAVVAWLVWGFAKKRNLVATTVSIVAFVVIIGAMGTAVTYGVQVAHKRDSFRRKNDYRGAAELAYRLGDWRDALFIGVRYGFYSWVPRFFGPSRYIAADLSETTQRRLNSQILNGEAATRGTIYALLMRTHVDERFTYPLSELGSAGIEAYERYGLIVLRVPGDRATFFRRLETLYRHLLTFDRNSWPEVRYSLAVLSLMNADRTRSRALYDEAATEAARTGVLSRFSTETRPFLKRLEAEEQRHGMSLATPSTEAKASGG
jgi:hypothetical protein